MPSFASGGLWDDFAGALRTWGFILGGIGLVLQAAGHSLLERFDPHQSGRRLLAWLENPPGGARARLIRGVVLLVAGAPAVVWPREAVSAVIVLVGGGLAFVGLREPTTRFSPGRDSVRRSAAGSPTCSRSTSTGRADLFRVVRTLNGVAQASPR